MVLPLYYNWRNLLARRLSTALTFVVVGVVVFVLALLLSFAAGMRASLVASGSPENILVLKPGATSESTSILRPEEVGPLAQTPGLRRLETGRDNMAAGTLLLSPELCVQTNLQRLGAAGGTANVAVRGVDDIAFDVHREIKIVEGRRFEPGSPEALVGRAARDRFAHLHIGDEFPLGRKANRMYTVVGVFDAAGGALESEIWTPRTMLTDAYQRHFVSSVCLRLTSAAAADQASAYIGGSAVNLDAKTEPKYYDELASKTREIVVITTILVAIMAIGAIFAVANTLYAAVDGRRREIAMLRTIGFGRLAIILAFVLESLLICTPACLAGLAGSLAFNGVGQDYLSDATWTVFAYKLRLTPEIVGVALTMSIAVAVLGALAPAVRASRTNVLQTMRKG